MKHFLMFAVLLITGFVCATKLLAIDRPSALDRLTAARDLLVAAKPDQARAALQEFTDRLAVGLTPSKKELLRQVRHIILELATGESQSADWQLAELIRNEKAKEARPGNPKSAAAGRIKTGSSPALFAFRGRAMCSNGSGGHSRSSRVEFKTGNEAAISGAIHLSEVSSRPVESGAMSSNTTKATVGLSTGGMRITSVSFLPADSGEPLLLYDIDPLHPPASPPGTSARWPLRDRLGEKVDRFGPRESATVTKHGPERPPEWGDPLGSVPLSLPHWHVSGRTVPAVFARASSIRVRVRVESEKPTTGAVHLSAKGPLFQIPETPIQFSGKTSVEVILPTSGPLPNRVQANAFGLTWSARHPGGDVFAVGMSQHMIYTTYRRPIVFSRLLKPLVEWSTRFAEGLSDDKEICDALIRTLSKTGLRYGGINGTAAEVVRNKGGMCGSMSHFFCHYCGTQGVNVSSYGFTLNPVLNDSDDLEVKWVRMQFSAPGLNNPPRTGRAGLVLQADTVYPMPRFFGDDSPDDDVTSRSPVPYSWEFTTGEGHVINFLKYGNKHYLYDPSFGLGPVAGVYGESINEGVMRPSSLRAFRTGYFDSLVDHIRGRIFCRGKDGVQSMAKLDVKTSLIPDKELLVYVGSCPPGD